MSAIAFAGCKYTTRDCIRRLRADGIDVDVLITISPETAHKNSVAGYEDLRPFAESQGIEVYTAARYDLKSPADEAFIAARGLGVLLVIGWERLIPQTVLRMLEHGAFGMHGSPRGLPYGRGRSPLNWSLILDEKAFRTSLFRYSPGVDDGDIVGTVEFEINEFDTCKTLHFKNRMAMNWLLQKHLPAILAGAAHYETQPAATPTFFPRRRPEDGATDWSRGARFVYNHVRALTRPYPGAYADVDGVRVRLWACQPFGRIVPLKGEPGLIREVFGDGTFLVEAGDELVLVTDYEPADPAAIREGAVFAAAPLEALIETIAERYPPDVTPEQMEITPQIFAR